MHSAHKNVSLRVLWSRGQSLDQRRLGRCERHGLVVGKKINAPIKVNYRRANQCFDITGVERQSTFKKAARLRQVFVG
jgi:hypothetical protein